jgi:hypothetical protein
MITWRSACSLDGRRLQVPWSHCRLPSRRACREIAAAPPRCDIVYATANEIGFDFLRDRSRVRRRIWCDFEVALVDRADSILIDKRASHVIAGGVVDESLARRMAVLRRFTAAAISPPTNISAACD